MVSFPQTCPMGQTNPPFMSGVPELLVLRLLSGQELYGYERVKALRVVTAEAIALGKGVINPVLHGLEKAGCLRARRKPINGRIRVCYAVTPKGQQRLRRATEKWSRISAGIESALRGAEQA